MVNKYSERKQEFARNYEDAEADDVVSLVVATGDWLERLTMQPEAADAAMKSLYKTVVGAHVVESESAASWRELWTQLPSSAEFDLRTSQYFVDLNSFAFWGLRPNLDYFGIDGNGGRIVSAMEDFVRMGRALIDGIPPHWGTRDQMVQSVLAAEARLRIDTDRDVTTDQLAALARVSAKSIKNLLAPSSGAGLRADVGGRIPASAAQAWLTSRDDYMDSLWMQLDETEEPTFACGETGVIIRSEVLFIPVAADGSRFEPGTCRNGRYQVGLYGDERYFEDYREALQHLQSMAKPSWRRPNANGNWGIVRYQGWARVTAAELGLGG